MKELMEPWPQLNEWIGINGANTTQFMHLLVAIQNANLVESRFYDLNGTQYPTTYTKQSSTSFNPLSTFRKLK